MSALLIPCYIMSLEVAYFPLMIPVGDTLRRTRLKRNLQLEEISNELKISTRFLQAIENDQYDKLPGGVLDRKSTRLNSSHLGISYAVFCLKKKTLL